MRVCVSQLQKLMIEFFSIKRYDIVKDIMEMLLKSKVVRILAFNKVWYNSGGKTPGCDGKSGMSVKELKKFIYQECSEFVNIDFRVKRVLIPKEDGSRRPLGIPNFLSRTVQEVIRLIVEPIIDHESPNLSFGFREGRGIHDALRGQEFLINTQKWDFLWNIDISKCFDRISHETIINNLEGWTPSNILKIISKILKGSIVEKGRPDLIPSMGTPQGGVISPLLCNLVLNKLRSVKLDHLSYIEVVRYADDCVIFIKGDLNYWKNHVTGILASIGLELNHNKSEVFDFKGSMFKYKSLGYDVWVAYKKVYFRIPDKSVKRLFSAWKKYLQKKYLKGPVIVDYFDSVIRGVMNFYCLVEEYEWNKYVLKFKAKLDMLIWFWVRRQRLNRSKSFGHGKHINKFYNISNKRKWKFAPWVFKIETQSFSRKYLTEWYRPKGFKITGAVFIEDGKQISFYEYISKGYINSDILRNRRACINCDMNWNISLNILFTRPIPFKVKSDVRIKKDGTPYKHRILDDCTEGIIILCNDCLLVFNRHLDTTPNNLEIVRVK